MTIMRLGLLLLCRPSPTDICLTGHQAQTRTHAHLNTHTHMQLHTHTQIAKLISEQKHKINAFYSRQIDHANVYQIYHWNYYLYYYI